VREQRIQLTFQPGPADDVSPAAAGESQQLSRQVTTRVEPAGARRDGNSRNLFLEDRGTDRGGDALADHDVAGSRDQLGIKVGHRLVQDRREHLGRLQRSVDEIRVGDDVLRVHVLGERDPIAVGDGAPAGGKRDVTHELVVGLERVSLAVHALKLNQPE
jgi:hypothetical protein